MGLKTGVDIVAVDRFENLLNKHGDALTQEFFTRPEQHYARDHDSPSRCYATYWALREAAYKIGGGSLWNDYSVDPSGTGFSLIVDPDLYDRDDSVVSPDTDWSSSVTCTDGEVIATVLANGSANFT